MMVKYFLKKENSGDNQDGNLNINKDEESILNNDKEEESIIIINSR